MPKLVLFDIDGTLVLTGRAGVRAMNRVMETAFGEPDALRDIPVAGRTDWAILDEAVARQGRVLDSSLLADLRQRYLANLAEEIVHRGEGRKAVMPGVREVLDALQDRPDVLLGLLTGNFEGGARIKLEYFDLWRYFRCGAFADDASDRNALVPYALDRARACGLPEILYRDVLVIGDTPADVACAHAVGATAVAVATGSSSVADLQGTGAEYVFENLRDTQAVLRLMG